MFLHPHKIRFVCITALRFISDIARLYQPIAFASIITFVGAYVAGQSLSPLWWNIAFIAIAAFIHISARQTAKIIGNRLTERIALDAQLQTLQHLFLLDLSWHESENSGNKIKRIQRGGDSINQLGRMWINSFIEILVTFVGVTVVLATFEIVLSVAMVCFMGVFFVISRQFTKRAVRFQYQANIEEEDVQGLTFEAINNIRSVKVLGMASSIERRITRAIDTLFLVIQRRVFWYQSRDWVLVLYSHSFSLVATGFIALGVLSGRYELGFLILFIDYFRKIWESIDEMTRVILDFDVAKYGVYRMIEMLKVPVMIDVENGKKDVPNDWDTIEVQHLLFGYGDNQDVLKDVSLTIRRGERIGIVGVSGAGKSTLFKLLLKEHENFSGTISIGGVPLRDIRRTSYFKHAAVVLQDTEVFNFTLRDNITLANPNESDNAALLHNAVSVAHVSDFLERLPEGLETLIGEKGVKLSGGEKQRVGIARAVFKQPEILFLDEATSHLDTESEEKIRDSLHHFFQNVTAVVIAHRLSTIKEMDRILVLENGTIIEEGSFEELFAKKGRFYELWEKQKF